ncbi:hypothetical protein HMPREF1861_01344 [Corynebacterium kroppenstedtii]|nr:hypothetical protein HMPREF1861_01344 [Corynebacterium kroppenstedtii]
MNTDRTKNCDHFWRVFTVVRVDYSSGIRAEVEFATSVSSFTCGNAHS